MLGEGGLELQVDATARALEERGHHLVRVANAPRDEQLDVLHAFGSEPDIWHLLRNWRRNGCKLVITPVISISTPFERVALGISARLPGVISSARMRRELLDSADAVVALTQYERRLVETVLGAARGNVVVIGNGVEPPTEANRRRSPTNAVAPYAVMVGRVSHWKRQVEVLDAVGPAFSLLVVGDIERGMDQDEFTRRIRAANARWLGYVDDRCELWAIVEHASALVHLSRGEVQSLAVLEALSVATPVLLSDIPPHRELRDTYPDWVYLVTELENVLPTLEQIAHTDPAPEAPSIPTMDEIAVRLEQLYAAVTKSDARG